MASATARDDLDLLIDAVREAGTLAMRHFRTDVKTWTKGEDDPVTEADIAVNKMLFQRLREAQPAYGWLSEETEDNDERLDCARLWIVDPIDGTRAFIEGRAEFTIAAAMVDQGRPRAAAVFNPATDELFDAIEGGGARLNGEAISVSARDTFDDAHILASSRTVLRAIQRMADKPVTYDIVNSIAFRISLVAAGRFDATFSLGAKSDWDLAAADLIVQEAGGRLSDVEGGAFTYNSRRARHPSVLAAGPAMHDALREVIAGIDW
ncbi:MAG: 3'(2'),5'-bisphosphate nucleotidase CysQ [Pseudomonadota bacterium]